MRSVQLAWILGGLVFSLVSADRAAADTVFLTNGSFLTGNVEGAELTVLTDGGPVKLGVSDLGEVILGTLGGDVVRDRAGRATTGRVEQSTYAVRLPSGQTVMLARAQVSQIRFRGR
jgi:hypothetical protein